MDYFIKIITVITRYQSKKSKIGRKLWRKLPIWGKYKHMCVLYITGCPIWMGWILNSYNGFIFGVGHFQMLRLFNHKALQNIYPHPNQTPCICKQNTLPAFLFPPSFPDDVVFKLLYSIMDEITYYILYIVFATHTHTSWSTGVRFKTDFSSLVQLLLLLQSTSLKCTYSVQFRRLSA